MEANHHHQTPARRTSRILRLIGVSLVGLIAATGTASAQLGSVTGSLTATPDVSQVTSTVDQAKALLPVPIIDEAVGTPLGGAQIYADAERVHACHQIYAALPVPIVAAAAAENAGCLDLSASGMNLTMAGQAADMPIQLDAGADLPSTDDGKAGAWAEVKGFFNAAVDGAVDLF